MATMLRVGDLAASVGSKVAGRQSVEAAGLRVEVPVFLINGEEDGPTLVVTAGIHGAEYACIAAALQLGRSLEPTDLRV